MFVYLCLFCFVCSVYVYLVCSLFICYSCLFLFLHEKQRQQQHRGTQLWNELQGQILQVDEKHLSEVLMERHAIEEALNVEINRASDTLKKTDGKQRIVLSLVPKLIVH
jgi:hypothetical protein